MKTGLTARVSNSFSASSLRDAVVGGGIGIGFGIGRESLREKKYARRWRKEFCPVPGWRVAKKPINQPNRGDRFAKPVSQRHLHSGEQIASRCAVPKKRNGGQS